MTQEDTRVWEPLRAGTLATNAQRLIAQSSIVLTGKTQTEWAKAAGLDPAYLSRMLNGHWVVREEYAEAVNSLVAREHPIHVPALAA